MKRPLGFLLSFAVTLGLICCNSDRDDALLIGAASNLQFAMVKLADEFEEETGIQTQLLINSSGNISAQIEQGLPIDVFVSADMQYPMVLYREGYGKDRPMLYALGEIVIVSHSETEPDFESMLADDVDNVAIASPKTAPYGQKAKLALQNAGIWDSIQQKVVTGDNVSHAHHFVSSGAARMGIIAKSLVVGSKDAGIAGWTEIPDSLYNPIMQGMMIIKHEGLNYDHAQAFMQFMVSDKAKAILNEQGYRTSFGE